MIDFANTAYGQIDKKGWSGLCRFNSIEGNFGGGQDPSNSAARRRINKANRPISANHMRSVKKQSLLNSSYSNREDINNYKQDFSQKQVGMGISGLRTKSSNFKNSISTAAVSNPTYNASLMS